MLSDMIYICIPIFNLWISLSANVNLGFCTMVWFVSFHLFVSFYLLCASLLSKPVVTFLYIFFFMVYGVSFWKIKGAANIVPPFSHGKFFNYVMEVPLMVALVEFDSNYPSWETIYIVSWAQEFQNLVAQMWIPALFLLDFWESYVIFPFHTHLWYYSNK